MSPRSIVLLIGALGYLGILILYPPPYMYSYFCNGNGSGCATEYIPFTIALIPEIFLLSVLVYSIIADRKNAREEDKREQLPNSQANQQAREGKP